MARPRPLARPGGLAAHSRTNRSGLAILLLCAACASAPRNGIRWQVIASKADTKITVHSEGERALLDIFSASGVGSAELEITSPALPRHLLMRFHLRGLEELRFAYAETVITASLSSTQEQKIQQSLSSPGVPAMAEAITSEQPQWMKMRLVPAGNASSDSGRPPGVIEVEAPRSFIAAGHRRMTIHWIDFYR